MDRPSNHDAITIRIYHHGIIQRRENSRAANVCRRLGSGMLKSSHGDNSIGIDPALETHVRQCCTLRQHQHVRWVVPAVSQEVLPDDRLQASGAQIPSCIPGPSGPPWKLPAPWNWGTVGNLTNEGVIQFGNRICHSHELAAAVLKIVKPILLFLRRDANK